MSKTFKSDNERDKTLGIDALDDRIRLEIEDRKHLIAIIIDNSQAAALALAILEAAGVEPDREPLDCQVSLGTIVADLQDTIKHGEALAAEARERAELEAEALELRNEYFDKECAWSDINDVGQALWLRMARKARELAKEATK